MYGPLPIPVYTEKTDEDESRTRAIEDSSRCCEPSGKLRSSCSRGHQSDNWWRKNFRTRDVQAVQRVSPNDTHQRFVEWAKRRHDVAVLRLGDELCEDTDVLHRALRVRDAHRAIEEVDRAEPTRVVQPVLRARRGVQLEQDAQAVLARPFESLECVCPRRVRQEGLAGPYFNRPIRHGQAHPVEACTGDLSKVLLGLGDSGG
jgi:hypothetical protein